jgi:hypothetical protein
MCWNPMDCYHMRKWGMVGGRGEACRGGLAEWCLHWENSSSLCLPPNSAVSSVADYWVLTCTKSQGLGESYAWLCSPSRPCSGVRMSPSFLLLLKAMCFHVLKILQYLTLPLSLLGRWRITWTTSTECSIVKSFLRPELSGTSSFTSR